MVIPMYMIDLSIPIVTVKTHLIFAFVDKHTYYWTFGLTFKHVIYLSL